jgi:uncharacterized protein (DUF2384 family)
MKNIRFNNVPISPSNSDVVDMIRIKSKDSDYLNELKMGSKLNDDLISECLNINVKTYRKYKEPDTILKENIKEHVLLLISLFRHGDKAFGTNENFTEWLNKENFFLDNNKPFSYLNTITGIRLVDSRITAMEYGDNV